MLCYVGRVVVPCDHTFGWEPRSPTFGRGFFLNAKRFFIQSACPNGHRFSSDEALYWRQKPISKGGLNMRALVVCAIIISAAVGLAGCFHHQQAVVAEPMRTPPLK
jgi:hypothetical protein